MGGDHPAVAQSLNNLALVYQDQGRYGEAEPLHRRALTIAEKALGPDDDDVLICMGGLALVLSHQGRDAEAQKFRKRVLEIQERLYGPDHPDVALSLSNLAASYAAQARYAEAESLCKRALAIRERALGRNPSPVAASLSNLATLYADQGRYAEAEPLYKRALDIREKALGPNHLDVAPVLNGLANLDLVQGRYAEAEPLYRRALAINEKALGPDHPTVAGSLGNLANVRGRQGQYTEAEASCRRVLTILEKALGPDHPETARSIDNLAGMYHELGRYAEAEPLYKRALTIREKALGPDHPEVAHTLNRVANLCSAQGRYSEAEPLLKRALAIRESVLGPQHPKVAWSCTDLATLYWHERRLVEAEPLYKRALALDEKSLRPNHPDVATVVNNLALVCMDQGRFAEAEPLFRRALSIWEGAHGPIHPNVAHGLKNLASLYTRQDRYTEAESLYTQALTIREKALGPAHPGVAGILGSIAFVSFKQDRLDQAESLLDRAVGLEERVGVAPGQRSWTYGLRAEVGWKAGHRSEAIADLHRALDLAEQQRGYASGGEHERAESFGKFAAAFEQMVAWQAELGDVGEVFRAIERSRARSLLDEIGVTGADLAIGRTAAERERLRQSEGELRTRIAGLETKEGLAKDADVKAKLQAELAAARMALYEHFRDARSSNPIYRNLTSTGAGPPRLRQVQRRLAGDSILLAYLFGEEGGFVLVARPNAAGVAKLAVSEADSRVLAVQAGPLTAQRLQSILIGSKGNGVVTQLADSSTRSDDLTPKLAVLWRVLVPESERQALVGGKVKRLLIVPDGPLALLPFETLVVEEGKDPEYLLDAGPPIAYGPSATVLYNLAERPAAPPTAGREPVLTVGDPDYGEAGAEDPNTSTALAALTVRSRYSGAGARLNRLPHSGTEMQWVAKDFNEAGIKAVTLSQKTATELGVRYWSPGRRVLHLACHGLADEKYGNFFGALALTPGPKATDDPSDDGFLTLPEIYELNLKGCELAILSACQTNYGPQQKGEGTWALSRGFLVAGSRRVVASDWLVDDEAAASLVSRYCGGLAQAEKAGKTADYAASLQEAKRWVRKQDKWQSPYYWASLVLVGPP